MSIKEMDLFMRQMIATCKEMGVPVNATINFQADTYKPQTIQAPRTTTTATNDSAPKSDGKKPYWTNEFKGKLYICARTGQDGFEPHQLDELGMKQSKKNASIYSLPYTELLKRNLDELISFKNL